MMKSLLFSFALIAIASARSERERFPTQGRPNRPELKKGQVRNLASFNTWCTNSWDQKRACMAAAKTITEAVNLLESAVYIDDSTGQYTVDISTTFMDREEILITNTTGYVVYDGTGTDFVDVHDEDVEFWKVIRRNGFGYLLEDVDTGAPELLSYSRRVFVRPPREDEEESTDEFGEVEEPLIVKARAGKLGTSSGQRVSKLLSYIMSVSVPIV